MKDYKLLLLLLDNKYNASIGTRLQTKNNVNTISKVHAARSVFSCGAERSCWLACLSCIWTAVYIGPMLMLCGCWFLLVFIFMNCAMLACSKSCCSVSSCRLYIRAITGQFMTCDLTCLLMT